MIVLTVSLGRWQTHRAAEKEARQAMFEARMREAPIVLGGDSGPADALLYRRVRATGEWIAAGQIFIDNQVHQGRAGFHVITPLRIAGSDRAVLVNRGWIARTAAYPAAPPVEVPAGRVTVDGVASLPPARVLELSSETVTGNVWQNLSLARYAERMRIPVLPVVVLADRAGDALAAVRERPDLGIDRHREYSLTWFSLAVTLAVLWIVFTFRIER
ncbi:MAG: SURF1 family protein [Bacillota bacterium]